MYINKDIFSWAANILCPISLVQFSSSKYHPHIKIVRTSWTYSNNLEMNISRLDVERISWHHGTYIRWYFRNRCAHQEQSMLFDQFKAFD